MSNVSGVEWYFQQLIKNREVSHVVVCDFEGHIIFSDSLKAAGNDTDGAADRADGAAGNGYSDGAGGDEFVPLIDTEEDSNVVISGARAIANFKGLGLGIPQCIAVQFHDAMTVQFCEGSCVVSLIGHRSQDHCIGGLMALAQQMRTSVPVFQNMISAVNSVSSFI